jgi:hypothetical protein
MHITPLTELINSLSKEDLLKLHELMESFPELKERIRKNKSFWVISWLRDHNNSELGATLLQLVQSSVTVPLTSI